MDVLSDEFQSVQIGSLNKFKEILAVRIVEVLKNRVWIGLDVGKTDKTYKLSEEIPVATNADTKVQVGLNEFFYSGISRSPLLKSRLVQNLRITIKVGKDAPEEIKTFINNNISFSTVEAIVPKLAQSNAEAMKIIFKFGQKSIEANIKVKRKVYHPKFYGVGFPMGEVSYPTLKECSSALTGGTSFDRNYIFFDGFVYKFSVGNFSWTNEQQFFTCARVEVLDLDKEFYTNSALLPED